MSDKAPKDAEQRAAEADVEEFKDDLGPFVIAAETTRMAMVFTDAKEPDNPIIFANDSFLKLTGYDRDEVLAQSFNFLLASGTSAETMNQIEAAFAGDSDDAPEVHYRRKDGSEFWASVFINAVRDDDDNVVQHFISLVDQTRHHAAQDHSNMLIDELNHRVKNTLATVQSIVAQAIRTNADRQAVRESIESRIAALSRSHDLLSRENWLGANLTDVIAEALEPFGATEEGSERFSIRGDNIRLLANAALALGVAFNELATNAVKYGAFFNEAGTVSISWTVESRSGEWWLCLRWQEQNGPPVAPPSRKGFGSRVIEHGIAHEMQGRAAIDYHPEGIVCIIEAPIA